MADIKSLLTEIESISLCTCTEPAGQLIARGLFPCAPSLPSLAVDLQMLDFAQSLFMNAAPNTTAWCETLEGFLSSRRFKLKTRVSFLAILLNLYQFPSL
jgi:CxC1 like cysteine cluster associated with KDZ transposases